MFLCFAHSDGDCMAMGCLTDFGDCPDLVATNYGAAGVAGAYGIDSEDFGFKPRLDFCEQKDHVRRIPHCANASRARKMLRRVLLARYCGCRVVLRRR